MLRGFIEQRDNPESDSDTVINDKSMMLIALKAYCITSSKTAQTALKVVRIGRTLRKEQNAIRKRKNTLVNAIAPLKLKDRQKRVAVKLISR